MQELIDQIESRTGYTYRDYSLDTGYHRFTINYEYKDDDREHFHYYKTIPCDFCGEPYFQKKYTKATKHKKCSCKLNQQLRAVQNG